MGGKGGLIAGVAAGVVVIGGLLYFAMAPVEDAPVEKDGRREKAAARETAAPKRSDTIAEVKPSIPSTSSERGEKTRAKKPRMFAMGGWYEELPSGKDRTLGKNIQDALDADDQAAILKAAAAAQASQSVEVRKAAVEALSLQGTAAITNLVAFIADPDGETSEAAFNAWDDAVDQYEYEGQKVSATAGVLAVAKNPEHIERAVSRFESMDETTALRALTRLAESDDPNIAASARQSYENVTGKEWKGKGAALLEGIMRSQKKAAAAEDAEPVE